VESPALQAIRETFEGGAVVSGSSAGVSCLPWSVMIAGGTTYNGLRYGSFPLGTEGSSSDLVYDAYGGLGLMYDFVLDTHFSERGREGRLIRLIADTRTSSRGVQYGIGVDEDTALVVLNSDTPAAQGQVVGKAGVVIVDLSGAFIDTSAQNFRILNVNTHYITEGDVIDLHSREVTFDLSWKTTLAGNQQAITSNDVFGGIQGSRTHTEYIRVARSLFDSRAASTTSGTTKENNPKFQVTFNQNEFSVGYGGTSPVTGKFEISYSNLRVSIESAKLG